MIKTASKKTWGAAALAALAALFLALTIVTTFLFRGARLDLTENRLYSIAPGTQRILDAIDEPINLYFFFSQEASREVPALRAYANRVRELLEEIAQRSDGGLRLSVIDPQPFSEQEDRAAEFGLTAVPIGARGETLYFGLAGTNAIDGREVISFFQPEKEEFLEYDVARLVYRLANPKTPVVGLLSSLPVDASFDPMSGQMREGWSSIAQLRELLEVRSIPADIRRIDEDIDVLLAVHPKELTPATLYAIDQFVMRGGKLLAFVDPQAEQEGGGPMGGMGPGRSSDLGPLLAAWGIKYDAGQVLGDLQHALAVSMRAGQPPTRHLGVLGFGRDSMNAEDVVTAGLDSVNVMTAGVLAPVEGSEIVFEPLLSSSTQSALIPASRFQFLSDPMTLLDGFEPDGKSHAVAARVRGKLKSAYPDGAPPSDEAEGADSSEPLPPHLGETAAEANLIVVADTDILSDPLWVRTQNLFGQRFAVAWANNGDLLANALENLAGSGDLISVRGRQSFFRPFNRVENLRREADERLRSKEQELDLQLRETERKLTELESSRGQDSSLLLSPEQQAELERFQQERLRIRRELREVRRGLDVEIDRLGTTLKFVNIALVPGLLALGALAITLTRRRRLRAGRTAVAGAAS